MINHYIGDGLMVIFSGRARTGTLSYSDIWLFNLNTNTWTEVLTIGEGVKGRYGR
jgi:hypothetical protein